MRAVLRRAAKAVVAGSTAFAAQGLAACPVCWGDTSNDAVRAANAGVIVMLVITVAVLGAFSTLFLYFRRRALLLDHAEQSEGGLPS